MNLTATNFSLRAMRSASSRSDSAVGTVGRFSSRLTVFIAGRATVHLYAPPLFETQGLDGIQVRGLASRVETEEDPNGGRKCDGAANRDRRDENGPVQQVAQDEGCGSAEQDSERAAEEADDHGFNEELALNVLFG